MEKPVCLYEDCLYVQKNWVYENSVIKKILELSQSNRNENFSSEKFQSVLEKFTGLEEAQIKAVETCFHQNLTLISGGPGTGKTFTAVKIIESLYESFIPNRKLKVLLGAPTGKASFLLTSKITQKILEQVDLQAKTLHALLGILPDRHIEIGKVKIDADLVLVDEASMIDLRLMAHLLSKIGENTKLVLIGDKNQLSPIDTGQVFSDLCSIENTVYLDKTHRFSNGTITKFTQSVCLGEIAQALEALESRDPCLNFKEIESLNQLDSYLDFFPSCQKEFFDPEQLIQKSGEFRILSALKQGVFGVDLINRYIAQKKIETAEWGANFAYPIMVTTNDYQKGLFNGMVGICITQISKKSFPYGKDPKVYFSTPEGIKVFSLSQIHHFELAYAMTVHKSQGSEFSYVVAILPEASEQFGRELLYTAATRCKKKITLITKKSIVSKIIETHGQKFSLLRKRLSRNLFS